MNKFEILKEWYYKEEERKESLNNNINIQIGILTALIAALYFLATNYNFEVDFNEKKWFVGLLIIAAISWIVSITFLLLAYHAYHYAHFPSPYFIDEEYNIIEPYFEEHKELLTERGKTKENLVQDNIENLLKQCISRNVKINDRKSGYIYRSKMCVFISLTVLFISSLFFIFNFINNPKNEIHSVNIVKNMAKDEALPPPPSNNPPRLVREGHVPKIDPGSLGKTPPPPPPPPKEK